MIESSSILCTIKEYDKVSDFMKDKTDTRASLSTTYGINNHSLLNKLEYFHVCNFGLPTHVMNDLLEGYVPYTMKLMLLRNKKYFSLEYLNNLILYFNYGMIDARNKPN